MNTAPHIPVMLPEVLAALSPRDGETYVDGTFGAGGYTRAILNSAECKVYAFDRDASVKPIAEKLAAEFKGRFVFLLGNFADMLSLLAEHGVEKVDGVVLDLGVSSMQLDEASRGFSFRQDAALDMRMGEGMSAADVVNNAEEETLANIIYQYGDEKMSRRIAKAIVKARTEKPITRTLELAELVAGVVKKTGKTHPATRTFQALRIHVNDEMGSLEAGLKAAEQILAPGARLVVVSFHSLEDRMVKQFLESRCGEARGASRHSPLAAGPRNRWLPTFSHKQKKKVSDAEAAANSRARSAILRTSTRTEEAIQ